jgi:hypothetical protein
MTVNIAQIEIEILVSTDGITTEIESLVASAKKSIKMTLR